MIQTTLLFSTKFNVVPTVPKFVLTDLTPYGAEGITLSNVKGVFKIEGPTGIIYNNTNFGAPDITGNVSLVFNTVSLPLDTNGAIINGDYRITYTVQIAGGVQPGTYTFADSSNYCYVAPTGRIQVTNSVRLATVTSSDLTTYAITGITPTLTRTHTLYYPSALVLSPLTGSTAQLNLAYPNVYTGTYTGKLSTTASYVFSDGLIVDYLITAVDESIVDGSTLCDIYCGLKNLTNSMISARDIGDFGKAGDLEEILSTVGFLLDLYDQAITCGKPDDATTWLNEIIKLAGITAGCGCDGDEPTQIIPIGGGGSSTTTVVAGDSSFGTQVSSSVVGSTTTYTVRLTDAYKALILSSLQSQDLSVAAFRTAGIPEEARGVQVTTLTAGGATISLTPATSKKVQIVIGNPTLTGSTVIQTVGTPIDGDSFIVDYRATAIPNGQTITIFGIQLSDNEISSGDVLVETWYAASTTTWYSKIISNTSAVSQDGLFYWQSGPDYVLSKPVLYGSNPSLIYRNILAAGSGSNPPTGTTASNTYWQYVGNKSILSDGADNIIFDVTSGFPYIISTLNTAASSSTLLVLEGGGQIKQRDLSTFTLAGLTLNNNKILVGNGSNVAVEQNLSDAYLRTIPINGVTGGTYTIITMSTSGNFALSPSTNTPTVKVVGTTTLTANYIIDATGSVPIQGDYFWVDYNANVTLGGNNISIFGVTLTASEALAGNLAVYAYWDSINSIWYGRKIIYGQNIPSGTINQTVRFSATNVLSADAGVTSDGSGNKRISKSLVVGNATTPTNKSLVVSDSSTETGTFNIVNGVNNTVSGANNDVAGNNNSVTGSNNKVAGAANIVTASTSVVSGSTNTVGGSNNQVSGALHVVSGTEINVSGYQNSVSCNGSFVTGFRNSATNASLVQITMFGATGLALNGNSFVEGAFTAVVGRSQLERVMLAALSTSATPVLMLNNGQRFALAVNATSSFEYKVSAIQSAGSAGTIGDTKSLTIKGLVKNIGGTISLVGAQVISDAFGDAGSSAWTVVATANTGAGSIDLTATGEANKTITWTAALITVKAGY